MISNEENVPEHITLCLECIETLKAMYLESYKKLDVPTQYV